jgi:hypothetical protein
MVFEKRLAERDALTQADRDALTQADRDALRRLDRDCQEQWQAEMRPIWKERHDAAASLRSVPIAPLGCTDGCM